MWLLACSGESCSKDRKGGVRPAIPSGVVPGAPVARAEDHRPGVHAPARWRSSGHLVSPSLVGEDTKSAAFARPRPLTSPAASVWPARGSRGGGSPGDRERPRDHQPPAEGLGSVLRWPDRPRLRGSTLNNGSEARDHGHADPLSWLVAAKLSSLPSTRSDFVDREWKITVLYEAGAGLRYLAVEGAGAELAGRINAVKTAGQIQPGGAPSRERIPARAGPVADESGSGPAHYYEAGRLHGDMSFEFEDAPDHPPVQPGRLSL